MATTNPPGFRISGAKKMAASPKNYLCFGEVHGYFPQFCLGLGNFCIINFWGFYIERDLGPRCGVLSIVFKIFFGGPFPFFGKGTTPGWRGTRKKNRFWGPGVLFFFWPLKKGVLLGPPKLSPLNSPIFNTGKQAHPPFPPGCKSFRPLKKKTNPNTAIWGFDKAFSLFFGAWSWLKSRWGLHHLSCPPFWSWSGGLGFFLRPFFFKNCFSPRGVFQNKWAPQKMVWGFLIF